jgi:hypothetical protein
VQANIELEWITLRSAWSDVGRKAHLLREQNHPLLHGGEALRSEERVRTVSLKHARRVSALRCASWYASVTSSAFTEEEKES